MENKELKQLISNYRKEYTVEVHSTEKHFVITGGNMTVNFVSTGSSEMKLFSSPTPTLFDSETCDRFIQNCTNERLINYEKISYEKWLQKRIKMLGRFEG